MPTNCCWCQNNRVVAFLCGIKLSAVHCLVLSQSMHVTDGQTDGETDGQNYDFQDRASIAAGAVKGKINETGEPTQKPSNKGKNR